MNWNIWEKIVLYIQSKEVGDIITKKELMKHIYGEKKKSPDTVESHIYKLTYNRYLVDSDLRGGIYIIQKKPPCFHTGWYSQRYEPDLFDELNVKIKLLELIKKGE
jgi:hypothetical protein